MRGGTHGDGHEVSILIRFGDDDCAGRGPSNVSTMIIRPPQHRQRRVGRMFSPSLLASARRRLGGALPGGEQLANARDVVQPNRSGEQAVVADAVEAARQHVQEKATDKLGGVERHGLEPVAAFDPVVFPFQRHEGQ